MGEVDEVVRLVLACPGVAALADAPVSYLPGRVVPGVLVDARAVEVGVVVTLDRPVGDTARAVQAALRPLAAGRPVDVTVAGVA